MIEREIRLRDDFPMPCRDSVWRGLDSLGLPMTLSGHLNPFFVNIKKWGLDKFDELDVVHAACAVDL